MKSEPRTEMAQQIRSLLDERLSGLSARIREWLEESHARAGSLTEIIEEARRETLLVSPDMMSAAPAGTVGGAGDLASFAQEVEASADQVAILGRLVDGAARHSSRVVLFLVRNEAFVGWFARGLRGDLNPRKISLPASGDSVLCRALADCRPLAETATGNAANTGLAGQLGAETVGTMLAAPLWVRDRVAAVLYADAPAGAASWSPDVIRVMVSLAALSLEAIPARSKFPRPVIETPASFQPEMPSPQPAPSPTAAAQETVEAEPDVDPEEVRAHEEAKRFARLLVSEIVLYNEKDIEEGRRSKDLYERLKEDIDRSRQMYLQRVAQGLTNGPDYFRQELVRSLAAGDESALNLPWD